MKLANQIVLTAVFAICVPAISAQQTTPVSAVSDTLIPDPEVRETLVLSREQCIEIALQSNPTVIVSDMEIKRMDYSKKETLAQLFPTIDFGLSYQRTIKLQTIVMSMGGQTQTIKMGTDNAWNMGFTASMPLIAPQLWKALKLSDNQILQSVEVARSSRLNLINQIDKAYYSLMLAKASYKVLQQNYENAKFNADLFEKKFKNGTATEYDVLRSSVQVKNAEPELLQAGIAIKQAQLQLSILMGIENTVAIEPNLSLEDMQQDMYGYVLGVERDLSQNTDLRKLDLQTNALRENVNMKKLAWVPTLGVAYNINWSAISNGSPFKDQKFNPYSNVGLSLNVPILGGGKYASYKGAQVQLEEMKYQRENLTRALNMQVELALDNITKEIRQIDSSADGVRQAEKAHQIMKRSFEVGAATYLDLRDSELADTSAKLTYYQAIYNYLLSTSDLDMLLGKEKAEYMSTEANNKKN